MNIKFGVMTPTIFPLSCRRDPILRERLKRPPPRGGMTTHPHLHQHRQKKTGRRRKAGDLKAERWRKGGVPGA